MSTKGKTWSFSREEKDVLREARKKTCLEKYGVENPAQVPEFQDKFRASMRRKKELGCVRKKWTYPEERKEEIKEKRRQTMLDRYGVESALQSEILKGKYKQTSIKRYGESSYTKTDSYIEKTKKTNVQKYGTEWANQNEGVKHNIKQSNLKRYGFENGSQLRSLQYHEKYDDEIIKLNAEGLTDVAIAERLGLWNTTVSKFLRSKGVPPGSITFPEQQIIDLLKVHFPELDVLIHDRTTLRRENRHPLEIDILIPSLKLGIEVNGSYWHQDDPENYKYNKYLLAKEKGIDLLHLHVENKFDENTLMIILEVVEKSYEIP